jgi:hypothetical protein
MISMDSIDIGIFWIWLVGPEYGRLMVLVGFTNIGMITLRHREILNLINYFGLRIVNDIDGLHRYRHFLETWLAIPSMKANDVKDPW